MGKDKLFKMCMEKILQIKQENPKKNEENAIKIARDILNKLEIKKAPVDISEILTGLGFKIYVLDSLENNISGIICISNDLKQKFGTDKIIILNGKDTLGRQRFTLAHEFSHFIFDFDLSQKSGFLDAYDTEKSDSTSEKISSRFAAELLMPKDLFLYEVNKLSKKEISYYDRISTLSDHFNVSTKSVERRLIELKKELKEKDEALLSKYNI